MKAPFAILPLAFLLIFSCRQPNRGIAMQTGAGASGLKGQLGWLSGTWRMAEGKGSILESWHWQNDSTLAGNSVMIEDDDDTTLLETLTIEQRSGDIYYLPLVSGQNNGQAVRFKLAKAKGRVLEFRNEAHDFPQLISYTRVSADSLLVEISGQQNGRQRREAFPMKRVR